MDPFGGALCCLEVGVLVYCQWWGVLKTTYVSAGYFMSWHNDIYHGSPTTRRYALTKVYDAALNMIVLHDEVEVGHNRDDIELDARGDSN